MLARGFGLSAMDRCFEKQDKPTVLFVFRKEYFGILSGCKYQNIFKWVVCQGDFFFGISTGNTILKLKRITANKVGNKIMSQKLSHWSLNFRDSFICNINYKTQAMLKRKC